MGELQENTPSAQKINAYVKGLEKRLGELIEQDAVRGGHISFGYVVLTSVAQGNYDRATKELESVGIGFEGYPAFEARSRRFVEHAKGLVLAIKTKNEVGKSPHVNKSKQKELSDRITEHFVDLKRTLIIIEKVQKSVRSADLGSTVFFFKTCFYSIAALFIFYTIYQNSIYSDTFSLRDLFSFFEFQWPD
ncbi:hypothetical protein K2X05_03250 [bacterium]|nr:hypothetical protein [bacterium]